MVMMKFAACLAIVLALAVASAQAWPGKHGIDSEGKLNCAGQNRVWGGPNTNHADMAHHNCHVLCTRNGMTYVLESANVQNDAPWGLQCCCIDYRGLI